MNTTTKAIILLAGMQSFATAATTVFGANVRGFNDQSGTPLGDGILGVLVVNTATGEGGDDGFNTEINAGAIAVNSTLDTNGDLLILNLIDSSFNLLESVNEINGAGAGTIVDLTGDAASGDEFAVYWFPGLSAGGGSTTKSAGDRFGFTRASDWVLGPDGGSVNTSAVASAGDATGIVAPEPTSTALLGLGALGFALRRRRA